MLSELITTQYSSSVFSGVYLNFRSFSLRPRPAPQGSEAFRPRFSCVFPPSPCTGFKRSSWSSRTGVLVLKFSYWLLRCRRDTLVVLMGTPPAFSAADPTTASWASGPLRASTSRPRPWFRVGPNPAQHPAILVDPLRPL